MNQILTRISARVHPHIYLMNQTLKFAFCRYYEGRVLLTVAYFTFKLLIGIGIDISASRIT